MQPGADASTHNSPSGLRKSGLWNSAPRLTAVPPPAPSTSRSWIEWVREEMGYVLATVGLDVFAAVLAVALAHWWTPGPVGDRGIGALSWLFVPIFLLVMHTRSMYRRKIGRGFLDDLEPVETSVAVAALVTLTVLLLAVPQFAPGAVIGQYVRPSELVVRIWVCAAILVAGTRLVRSLADRYLRRKLRFGSSALIIGSGPTASRLITRIGQVPEYGLHPVGVLDDVRPMASSLHKVPFFGSIDNFEVAVAATGATALIVAPTPAPEEVVAHAAKVAQSLGMRVCVVPRLMDVVGGAARVEHIGGMPLMVLSHIDPKGWQFAVKYALGKSIAAVGLLIISPLFLALALLVKMSSPGPVFFRQARVGRDGKVFDCLKFRTMRLAGPAQDAFALKAGSAPGGVEGVDRRTAIGRFMRKTSMDELPQLLNVLRGDMGLVGPRPERPEFADLFEMQVRRYGERHRVKAGITGWAQVHGLRGQTSIADRAEFDNYYIENWSLLLDIKILILTVLAVLRPTGD